MHHLYISRLSESEAIQKERASLVQWCEDRGVTQYQFLEEDIRVSRIPEKLILKMLSPVAPGDTVVVAQLSRLGRSLSMLATVMVELYNREVSIVCLSGRSFTPGDEYDAFVGNLLDIVSIEKDIKNYRSCDLVSVKRSEGAAIGRPKGSRKSAEKNVLFGKYELLEKMLSDGVPAYKIADTLGVSRGTVGNYIHSRKLK